MKLIKSCTALAAAVCCTALTSHATLILPGSNGSALGALTESGGSLVAGGTLLNQTFLQGAGQSLFGTISTSVYTGDTTAAGNGFTGYTFVYTVNLTSATPPSDTLETLSLTGFGGIGNIGVGYDPAGYTPGTGSLNGAGVVRVSFDTAANGNAGMPIPNSFTITIETDSQTFTTGVANAIDGSSPSAATLAAVPEPTTMVAGGMLLLPFAASTLRILRRKSAV